MREAARSRRLSVWPCEMGSPVQCSGGQSEIVGHELSSRKGRLQLCAGGEKALLADMK